MKRYRVIPRDFDTRALSLGPADETWEDKIKRLHESNRMQIIEDLKRQFGERDFESKIKNFIDMGAKPFSVLAFHNVFLNQIRNAFVIGSYYPALTGACALGERILNYLMLTLREYYRDTPEYKDVYRKDSFDNWPLAIDTLQSWGVLLPTSVAKFDELNTKRNESIHFRPEVDTNARELALKAISILQDIVKEQFASVGPQSWLLWGLGEIYIKKEWENNPFVKHIYLPNCALVGYKHRVESVMPQWVINDDFQYDERPLTDEEFINLRQDDLTPKKPSIPEPGN